MLSAASGRRSIAVKETCICWRKWIHPKKGEECAERGLCRCLCRNPAILTGIARDLSVSLCVTCQRHDTRQEPMDLGSPVLLALIRCGRV